MRKICILFSSNLIIWPVAQERNVLKESARIARGAISSLGDLKAGDVSALVVPGGFGAAKNLSDFGFKVRIFALQPGLTSLLSGNVSSRQLKWRLEYFSTDVMKPNFALKKGKQNNFISVFLHLIGIGRLCCGAFWNGPLYFEYWKSVSLRSLQLMI